MRFIPVDKLKNLREAAKNGDELAKKILRAQMNDQDFSKDLDSYFAKPSVEEQEALPDKKKTKLEQFLDDNGVKEGDEDYDATVEMYYNEFPNERPNKEENKEPIEEEKEEDSVITKLKKEEIDAMNSYSKAITEIMGDSSIEETQKKRIVARLKEIRSDEEEHFRELTELEAILNNQNEEKAPQE